MEDCQPLVSVGMPIRNGAKTLEHAIESIINQTYSNIEITISDNCSEDNTAEICRKYADRDHRIKYFRQQKPINALDNFRFVFEKSRGKYFMWAAHDDLRCNNYIQTLLKGFESYASASIIISDVVCFHDHNDLTKLKTLNYKFSTTNLPLIGKLRKSIVSGCHHLYGLINADYLRNYRWYNLVLGPDRPILLFLLMHGDFIYIPGTMLYIWKPASGKSDAERALDNYYDKPPSFPLARLSWYSARAVKSAVTKKNNQIRSTPFAILVPLIFLFYLFRKNTLKSYLFYMAPKPLRKVWYQKIKNIKHD